MNRLISIIVPVYNMERYLPKCIDSLLAQSYSNLEIILVDDGSKDGSLSVCQEYAARDERIRIVHKDNGGLSSARNAGLDVMQGELVTFVDADDYLEEEAISVMVEALDETGADIAYMRANIVAYDYSIIKSQSDKNTRNASCISSNDYVRGMCRKQKSESVCDKLFDAELFREDRFPVGRLNEDFYFLSRLLFADLKIAEVDFAGYNYYQREGSITRSGFAKSIVDAVKNSIELKELAVDKKPELEEHFATIALFQTRTALLTIPCEYVRKKSAEYNILIESVRKCMPHLKSSGLGFADRIFLRLVNKCPGLTLRFTSLLWKIKCKVRGI